MRGLFVAAGLAAMVGAQAPPASAQSVLKYVAYAEPRVLDPVANWLAITQIHGYLVYDTLYSLDANFQPQPGMVDKLEKNADGTVWTMTLRPDLRFHDGQKVTTADVIASYKRWAVRDVGGRKLGALGITLEAAGPDTLVFRMPEPTPFLLEALAKPTAAALFIMREKDAANTEPTLPVKEVVGSGPFRFVADQWQPGARLVYARNADYKPRAEPPSGLAGGKVVKIDRLEWLSMPDSATAVAALQRGEIDIFDVPPVDLLPLLKRNPDVIVDIVNKQGQIGFLRPNHTLPPFDKPEGRRALALLVDQSDYMNVAVGTDTNFWRTCYSFTACGGGNERTVGTEWMQKSNVEEAKRLLKQAGYDGRPIVIIAPGDNEVIKNFGVVTAEKMRAAGINVDLQVTDFGTMMARRNKREPADQGGWNIFPMWSFGFELDNVLTSVVLSSPCDYNSYPGWACDKDLETLKDKWVRESDAGKRPAIVDGIAREAAELVPVVPLGQFFAPIAYRKNITGLLKTPVPVMWNVEKKP